MKRIDVQRIVDQVNLEYQIKLLIQDAVYVEKFLAKPNNRNVPSMYSLIETAYSKEDYGYWTQKIKLRATAKQITRYEFVIDLLLMIKEDIIDDPIFARRLLWLRAGHNKWTWLAKHFGYHRTTLKNKYEMILERLANKVRKEIPFDKFDNIAYRI